MIGGAWGGRLPAEELNGAVVLLTAPDQLLFLFALGGLPPDRHRDATSKSAMSAIATSRAAMA